MCYMVPVGRGVRREYQDTHGSFTCCVGSGMESHGLHGDGIYYEAGDRLWINLYVPSTARWDAAGLRLETRTDFPVGEAADITLTLARPKALTLSLRRPSWAGEGFAVSVNGAALAGDLGPEPQRVERGKAAPPLALVPAGRPLLEWRGRQRDGARVRVEDREGSSRTEGRRTRRGRRTRITTETQRHRGVRLVGLRSRPTRVRTRTPSQAAT